MATLMLPCLAISGGSSTATAEVTATQVSAAARNSFIMKIASSDHRGKKGLSTYFTGLAQNLRRGPGLHDRAMVHIDDRIRHLAREAKFVRHHHHRHAAAGKFLHDGKHLACRDVQRDTIQGLKLPKILADRTDGNEGLGHRLICNAPRAKRR